MDHLARMPYGAKTRYHFDLKLGFSKNKPAIVFRSMFEKEIVTRGIDVPPASDTSPLQADPPLPTHSSFLYFIRSGQ